MSLSLFDAHGLCYRAFVALFGEVILKDGDSLPGGESRVNSFKWCLVHEKVGGRGNEGISCPCRVERRWVWVKWSKSFPVLRNLVFFWKRGNQENVGSPFPPCSTLVLYQTPTQVEISFFFFFFFFV